MSKIKKLKIKQDNGYSEINIGADANNIDYNSITLQDALDNITLYKNDSHIILTKPDGTNISVTDDDTTYSLVTQNLDGLMSKEDKKNLDNLQNMIVTGLDFITPKASSYCTIVNGGYYKIGKIVIINMAVKTSKTGLVQGFLTGFPTPLYGIPLTVVNSTTGNVRYGFLNYTQGAEINFDSTTATYRISGCYIS